MQDFFSNYVYFKVEGGNHTKLINLATNNTLEISALKATPLGFTGKLKANEYKTFAKLSKKCNCSVRIQRKKGIYFKLFSLRKRYGILVGAIAFFLLTTIMTNIIWDIEYYKISEKEQVYLATELRKVGIYEGAYKTKEDFIVAQKMVQVNTSEYAWLAINFVHGKLIVETELADKKQEIIDNSPTYIIAGENAIIEKITVYEGYAAKTIGQSVAEGELLVTGVAEHGLGKIAKGRSRAEVIAKVDKTYVISQPLSYTQEILTGEYKENKTLIFLDQEIPLGIMVDDEKNKTEENCSYDPFTILGLAMPATIKTQKVLQTKEIQTTLTRAQAETICVNLLEKSVYQDLKITDIITQTVEYEEKDGNLIATMYISAYCDIAVLVEQ